MQTWRRAFSGSLDEIAAAARWVDQTASAQTLPQDKVYALRLCMEGLLTNVLRHGGTVSPMIALTITFSPDRIVLVIEDDAKPFDVSTSIPRRVGQPLEKAQPGGLGIQLIHSFADGLSYTRADQKNRVVVEFVLPGLVSSKLGAS
jgi:serine/threonine-protein kinase RsbW